uniref:Uncharacterized protein n=1 Tax=Kalanchoe fedtschenkoi TaxID=63787 RepID=A0A7N0R9J4_KALFE
MKACGDKELVTKSSNRGDRRGRRYGAEAGTRETGSQYMNTLFPLYRFIICQDLHFRIHLLLISHIFLE